MIILLLTTALVATPISAETVKSLNWNACVEIAANNNSELRASRSTLKSTEALEGVAASGFYPSVTGSLTLDRGSAVVGLANGNRYVASLSGTQNLFSGLQDLGKYRQAKSNSAGAAAVTDTVRAKVSYDLKSAYQSLVYAKDFLQFTVESIRRREMNLNMVRLLFESGRENKGSVLLSQAYLEQARYEEIQARGALRVAEDQLSRSLGLDEDFTFEIKDDIPITEPPNEKELNLRGLASVTPEFRKAAADTEAADAAITVARSQFFPQLSVTGSMGRMGDALWPDDADRWSIGVNLSFPLFSGGKDYYSTRAAGATWAAAESTRMNVNRDLLAKLQKAFSSYNEAVAKLKVDDSFLKAATLRAEIARKRYNNGLLTFEDWDVIETDLINRQRTFLQSKRDRVISEAAWEQAQGKGVLP